MADFKQDNKDAQKYLETQKRIEKVVKSQTDSWKQYGDAQKTITENADMMLKIEKEILTLKEDQSAEAKTKREELQKELDKYLVTTIEKRDYLVEAEKLNSYVITESRGFFERMLGSALSGKKPVNGDNGS